MRCNQLAANPFLHNMRVMQRGSPRVWLRRAFYAFVILLIYGTCGQCCGPGRGGGRRRSPRKLTPLVFKQHVPNVAENTLGASGLTEGKISRDDTRFHNLVPNYNKDILFSDEEGTGADRLMTERCKEKLNSLAISVMNQWPGVRLRVTEAWDEGPLHAPNSLHYEGRAVDITTSDKDLSKHGMLARLAVLAGFDWVYYESRSRIHCSVKSESNSARQLGGCFPGAAQVETPHGHVPVRTLRQGSLVKVLRSDGSLAFSPVLMFLHKDDLAARLFLTLFTDKAQSITLTPSHLVFILRQKTTLSSQPTLQDALRMGEVVLAGRVNPGDYLLVTSTHNRVESVTLQRVVDMKGSTLEGVFAPLTMEGTLVIDNVVASCYAVIDSQNIAHWAFVPVRLYYKLKDVILKVLQSLGIEAAQSENKIVNYLNYNTIDSLDHETKDKADYYDSVKHKTEANLTIHKFSPRSRYSEDIVQHIHWYPKLLYRLTSWILPRHLVYT